MKAANRARRRSLLFAIATMALQTTPKAEASVHGSRGEGLRVESLDVLTTSGAHHFKVEIADTGAKRARGLMFRTSLAPDRGMLFDLKTPRPVAFWMKNTLVSLDMLFIAADGRIISVARDAVPKSEVPIPSGGAVRAVLEIAGGEATRIGAGPGDRIRYRIFQR